MFFLATPRIHLASRSVIIAEQVPFAAAYLRQCHNKHAGYFFWALCISSVPAIRNHSPHKEHICDHHSCYTPNGSGKCQSRWVLNFKTGRACQPTGGKFLGAAARKRGNFPHWALTDWKGLRREHSRLDITPKTTNIVCTSVCFGLTTSIIWTMLTWGYTCGFFIVINQLPTGMQPSAEKNCVSL